MPVNLLNEKDLNNYLTDIVYHGQNTEVFKSGDFSCSENGLTSLKGAPQKIGGDFDCWENELTTLENGPQIVLKNYNCSGNRLISLKGAPQKIGGDFRCRANNQLTSLKYISVCKYIYSDINARYMPPPYFSQTLSYRELQETPRFKKERQKILSADRRAQINNAAKRKEAAKNVSSIKGEIKAKRTGQAKIVAKINITLTRIKQRGIN